MILSYADKDTARVGAGITSRKLPPDIQPKALSCFVSWRACETGTICAIRRATASMPCMATKPVGMLYGSTISGGSCFARSMERVRMSRSPTIIEEVWSSDPDEWLPNPHAGDILHSEFLEPLSMSPSDLARAIAVPEGRIVDVVEGHARIDAELDLRLARYFKMSDGFFLGLQIDYELLEQRRRIGDELDRIVPRAA